ncbi:MAG: TonB-dependent receptor, partial [Bacteroidales bacterium]
MKTKLMSALVMLSLFLPQVSYGQDQHYTIKGRITDENGNPIEGVAVSIINTFRGTYSGFDGTYALKADTAGAYGLKFSFTGYEPVIKTINVPLTLIADVTLVPRFTRMEEVIVSATRAGERTPVTYSGVSGDEIRRNNLGQDLPFLIGTTPSLVETSEAGTGIGYTGFRIRGTDASRINITLDGIPLNDAESQQVFWVDLPDLASSVDNIQIQR